MIPLTKNLVTAPNPPYNMLYLVGQRGVFSKVVPSKTLHMDSDGLGEMLERNFADLYAKTFLLVSMGGQAMCHTCADTGARTPISASGIINCNLCIVFYVDSGLQLQWDKPSF